MAKGKVYRPASIRRKLKRKSIWLRSVCILMHLYCWVWVGADDEWEEGHTLVQQLGNRLLCQPIVQSRPSFAKIEGTAFNLWPLSDIPLSLFHLKLLYFVSSTLWIVHNNFPFWMQASIRFNLNDEGCTQKLQWGNLLNGSGNAHVKINHRSVDVTGEKEGVFDGSHLLSAWKEFSHPECECWFSKRYHVPIRLQVRAFSLWKFNFKGYAD